MPPSSPWIFICPSSRGIGYALTRHLLTTTSTSIPILATTRHPNPSTTKAALLENLPKSHIHSYDQLSKRLSVVWCDVTDESSIISAAKQAKALFPPDTHHLHLTCALPGVLLNPEKSLAHIDAHSTLESFQINALGPLLLAKHFFGFLPKRSTATTTTTTVPDSSSPISGSESADDGGLIHLPRHATWLTMSARVGSTTDNRSGGWFSYRASKAAVNSLTRSLDIHLRMRAGDHAMAVAYHPGTVRTELSKKYWDGVPEDKLFSPEYAAERLVGVIRQLGIEQRGRCWDWKGEEVPP